MRRQSQEEVAAAARRRLELLGRELAQAGLGPPSRTPDPRPLGPDESGAAAPPERGRGWGPGQVPDPVPPEPGPEQLPDAARAASLADAGRHARRRGASLTGRAAGWLEDRLP